MLAWSSSTSERWRHDGTSGRQEKEWPIMSSFEPLDIETLIVEQRARRAYEKEITAQREAKAAELRAKVDAIRARHAQRGGR